MIHYVRKHYRRHELTLIGDVIYLRLRCEVIGDAFFYVSYEKGHWRRVLTTHVSNDPSHRRPGLLVRVSNSPGAKSVLIGDAALSTRVSYL